MGLALVTNPRVLINQPHSAVLPFKLGAEFASFSPAVRCFESEFRIGWRGGDRHLADQFSNEYNCFMVFDEDGQDGDNFVRSLLRADAWNTAHTPQDAPKPSGGLPCEGWVEGCASAGGQQRCGTSITKTLASTVQIQCSETPK